MITKDRLATTVLLSEAKDANSKSKIIMRNTRLLLCTLMQLLVMLNILSEINLLWGKISTSEVGHHHYYYYYY